MKKKVVIVDPYASGVFHQVFNASVLIMASISFDTVHYIGQSSACDKMKDFILEVDTKKQYKNIVYQVINNDFKFNSSGWGHTAKLVYCAWVTLYNYIKMTKGSTLIVNQNIPTLLHLLNFLSKFKKNKIVIFCHSELEIVCNPKIKLAKSQIFMVWLFRNFFKKNKISKYIRFVLLADYMKAFFCDNIASYNVDAIFTIDHPYIKAPIVEDNNLSILYKDKIKIGITGLLSQGRGLNETIKLLDKINLNIPEIKIFAISRVLSEVNLEKLGLTYLNNSDELLPVNEYSNYVKQMDYILIMYSLDSYKLTASGAILEAVWWQKPIIALKNDYLVYLFEKYGDMGILCESIEELIYTITNINKVFFNNYELYCVNLVNARIRLLPENLQKIVVAKKIFD